MDVEVDAILAEANLDGNLSGLETIDRLRARFGSRPAALLTANRNDDLAATCDHADVERLLKPLGQRALVRFLDGAFQRGADGENPVS